MTPLTLAPPTPPASPSAPGRAAPPPNGSQSTDDATLLEQARAAWAGRA